jgi:hypothetical protein
MLGSMVTMTPIYVRVVAAVVCPTNAETVKYGGPGRGRLTPVVAHAAGDARDEITSRVSIDQTINKI